MIEVGRQQQAQGRQNQRDPLDAMSEKEQNCAVTHREGQRIDHGSTHEEIADVEEPEHARQGVGEQEAVRCFADCGYPSAVASSSVPELTSAMARAYYKLLYL